MSNRTITTNQLTPGRIFLVRGKVGFSRLTSRIEGEELRKDIQRRRNKGWLPIEKPYTTITINQAEVIVKDSNNIQPEEQYAIESLYTSSSQRGQGGYSYTANNKGTRALPYIAVTRAGAQGVVDQIQPEGELANGLDVTLVMRVFKGKPNIGVSLDGVIVNEPIRYFDNTRAGAGLDGFGITFNPLAPGTLPTAAETDNSHSAEQPTYAGHEDLPFVSEGAGAAANAAAPVTPAPAGVMPQATATAPMTPVAPAGNAMNAPINPMGTAPQNGGIRYDPNQPGSENRGY
jgi:hypothetical protein